MNVSPVSEFCNFEGLLGFPASTHLLEGLLNHHLNPSFIRSKTATTRGDPQLRLTTKHISGVCRLD
jgi:hypothetical protein